MVKTPTNNNFVIIRGGNMRRTKANTDSTPWPGPWTTTIMPIQGIKKIIFKYNKKTKPTH